MPYSAHNLMKSLKRLTKTTHFVSPICANAENHKHILLMVLTSYNISIVNVVVKMKHTGWVCLIKSCKTSKQGHEYSLDHYF